MPIFPHRDSKTRRCVALLQTAERDRRRFMRLKRWKSHLGNSVRCAPKACAIGRWLLRTKCMVSGQAHFLTTGGLAHPPVRQFSRSERTVIDALQAVREPRDV